MSCKTYKPGQIITINKNVYQIKKSIYGCIECDYIKYDVRQYPCKKCPVVTTCNTRRIKLIRICGKKVK